MNETNNTLTNDQVESLIDTMEEIKNESENLKEIANLPSNNGIEDSNSEENGEYKKVLTTVDPITGESIIGLDNSEIKEDTKSADDFLKEVESMIDEVDTEHFGEINVDEHPITEEELKVSMNNSKDNNDSVFSELFNPDELAEDRETMIALLELVNRKIKGEKINAFKEFPQVIKDKINSYITMSIPNIVLDNKKFKQIRNALSESILDEFEMSLTSERVKNDLNSEVEGIFNAGLKEIGDTVVGYTKERNEQFRIKAEQIEDPEKRANFYKILDNMDEAYNLTGLIEYSKKCKIRSVDIEKMSKSCYPYEILLHKYNDSNYNIYSIYTAETVLARNLADLFPDDNYTQKHARAFLIAFCNQCGNYTPSNTFNHAYMYYVLYNIMVLDINKGEKKEISEIFLNNIKACIENLKNRNKCL